MAKKIVLEYCFTFLQKLVILISVTVLILLIIKYIIEVFQLDDVLLLYALIISYPILIILAFSKKGFVVKNDSLFNGYFFLGLVTSKSRIDISNYPKVSVLKFKKNRKLPWFSIANPDVSADFNSFEINILNDRHTNRRIIIELKKDRLVKQCIDFLTLNTNLIYESYNPATRRNLSNRRR